MTTPKEANVYAPVALVRCFAGDFANLEASQWVKSTCILN